MSSDPRPYISNKSLFRWHGWIGLNLGLILFLVCFSGSIAVFSHEIDWLIDSDLRVEASDAPLNWTAMADSIQANYPFYSATFFKAPRHGGFASTVIAEGPDGRTVKFYLDPYTGEIQGLASFWNVQRFFRSFHRRMFIPNPYGIFWVTLFALVLLGSAVTGILFYKGWYRHLFRLRWRDARLLFSDGHRLAGVWSLPFIAVILATATWYGVEQLAPAPAPEVPEISERKIAERGPSPSMLDMNEMVEIARDTFPGIKVRQIIPGTPQTPAVIQGQAEAWLVRPRANSVYVDPVTGKVLSIRRGTEISAYHRIAEMADPLHFGTFAGLWTQTVWVVFGGLLSSLMLTGGWLWHLRAEKKARAAGAGSHPEWGYVAAAVPVILLVVSAWFGGREVNSYQKPEAPRAKLVAVQNLGPWRAKVARKGLLGIGQVVNIDVYLFDDDRSPNLQWAVATLRCEACAESDTSKAGNPLSFRLQIPDAVGSQGVSLNLRVKGGGNTVHEAQIGLPLKSASSTTIQGDVQAVGEGEVPIPTVVWVVIGIFVLLVFSVVACWLTVAHATTSSLRAADSSQEKNVEAVPVQANLPTSGEH